jgi:hypothetical protein
VINDTVRSGASVTAIAGSAPLVRLQCDLDSMPPEDVDRLQLAELLDFRPDLGVIRLHDQRVRVSAYGTLARYDRVMQDGDIVADRRDDGRYIIRRWRASDGALRPVDGHDEPVDEEEMYRRLNQLRSTGDTYVREPPAQLRLIQP